MYADEDEVVTRRTVACEEPSACQRDPGLGEDS